MSLLNSKTFFSILSESVVSGKISIEGNCPFCASELTYDQIKGMQTRIGRISYLLRELEKNSDLAYTTLYNIFFNREIYGGFDIPEDSPKWWIDLVHEIDIEERGPILIDIDKNTKTIVKNRKPIRNSRANKKIT